MTPFGDYSSKKKTLVYTSTKFKEFCTKEGIGHEKSYIKIMRCVRRKTDP
jgi:hypothetical protein